MKNRGYKFNDKVQVLKKAERQVPAVKVEKVGIFETCQNWLNEMVEAKIEARERDLQAFYGSLQRI